MPETAPRAAWEDEQRRGHAKGGVTQEEGPVGRGEATEEGKPRLGRNRNREPVKGRRPGEEEGEGQSVPAPSVSKRRESRGCPAHLAQDTRDVCSLP